MNDAGLRISATTSREYQLIVTALKRMVDRELAAALRKQSRGEVEPIWKSAIAEQASLASRAISPRQVSRVFVRTARVAVADKQVTLRSAGTGKALSGGLDYRTRWQVLEFGTLDREAVYPVDQTSTRGKRYTARRHTQRQLPPRSKGWVFYPAVRDAIPRIAALWAQTTMRVLADALEGRK